MTESRLFLLQAITRLVILAPSQITKICKKVAAPSTVWWAQKWLIKHKYIARVPHPFRGSFGYTPTDLAFPIVYGRGDRRIIQPRDTDLFHAIHCAEAIINLCKYENVTGFATEYELDKESLESFIHGRRPDAIIQISKDTQSFEIALEVEMTLKTIDRIEKILSAYQKTFEKNLFCQGVIIVAGRDDVYQCYSEQLSKWPEEFGNKILLTKDFELKTLKQNIYGRRDDAIRIPLELIRVNSNGVGNYVSIIPDSYKILGGPKGHIYGSQSGNESE